MLYPQYQCDRLYASPSSCHCAAASLHALQGSLQVLRLSTAFPYEVLSLSTKLEAP
jgi:hypothetical protein